MRRPFAPAIRRSLAFACRPYIRYELPGWEMLAARIGLPIRFQAMWLDAGVRVIRGKTHGLRMRLDLSDWCERLTYFLGRYYERGVEDLVRRLVREGELFVDIGANTGMITLAGAAAVGPSGRVVAIEPNLRLVDRLHEIVRENNLDNVDVVAAACGAERAQKTLTLVREANGWSTLGEVQRVPDLSYETVTVPVLRGDEILRKYVHESFVIKIDVEGFEYEAVCGLRAIIEQYAPAMIMETDPALLRNAGSSVQRVVDMMKGFGMAGYEIIERDGPAVLRRVTGISSHQRAINVLWMAPESKFHERVRSQIIETNA